MQHHSLDQRPQTAADVVTALRAIADKISTLGDAPLPNLYVSIALQPSGGEEAQVAAVDAIGGALYGGPGCDVEMSGGNFHHDAKGYINGVAVDAYCRVTNPEVRETKAELARLRAQLAEGGAK